MSLYGLENACQVTQNFQGIFTYVLPKAVPSEAKPHLSCSNA